MDVEEMDALGILDTELEEEDIADGTYQSQLRFAMRAMDKKFRTRYETLKSLYEERLESLSVQLQQIQMTVSTDDVLHQMQEDETSASYIPARRDEMVQDLVHTERERMIERLASDLAKAEAEAKQSFHDSQILRQKMRLVKAQGDKREAAAREELRAVAAERDELRLAADRAAAEAEAAKKQLAEEQRSFERERVAMRESVDKLKSAVSHSDMSRSFDMGHAAGVGGDRQYVAGVGRVWWWSLRTTKEGRGRGARACVCMRGRGAKHAWVGCHDYDDDCGGGMKC